MVHVQWWLLCKVVLRLGKKVEMQLIRPNAMADIDFITFSFPIKKKKNHE